MTAVAPPLDLRRTVAVHRQGGRDPTMRVRGDELWLASRTPDGPGTLHVCLREGQRQVEGWGCGGDWLKAGVPALLGDLDDPRGFRPEHPVVRAAAHRHPGIRIGRSGLVLPALVAAVVAQRITSIEAVRGWAALCRDLGGAAPGPGGLLLPPDPPRLAAQPSWWYHRRGIEGRRAATLQRVGRLAERLQEITAMPIGDAWARLLAVPGIGRWTAAEVAGSALGDADAVPVGDYHLPHVVTWALAGEARGDDARMLELLAPFAGHRGRVIRLLVADGHRPPRFGPRRPITPIARW